MAESEDRELIALQDHTVAAAAESHQYHGSLQNMAALQEHQQRFRVKLYELTGDNNWEDRGTGTCAVVYVEVNSTSRCYCFIRF
jgi:hypothetical protein